jgi:DNA polymerase III gamma/tau subunit
MNLDIYFSKIDKKQIAKRIFDIAALENITIDENAALAIANKSNGFMREDLNILEKCIDAEIKPDLIVIDYIDYLRSVYVQSTPEDIYPEYIELP